MSIIILTFANFTTEELDHVSILLKVDNKRLLEVAFALILEIVNSSLGQGSPWFFSFSVLLWFGEKETKEQ